MATTLTQSDYCMSLTVEQWDILSGIEYLPMHDLLSEWIVKGSLEYNGHYGRNIFFTLAAENIRYLIDVECKIKATLL